MLQFPGGRAELAQSDRLLAGKFIAQPSQRQLQAVDLAIQHFAGVKIDPEALVLVEAGICLYLGERAGEIETLIAFLAMSEGLKRAHYCDLNSVAAEFLGLMDMPGIDVGNSGGAKLGKWDQAVIIAIDIPMAKGGPTWLLHDGGPTSSAGDHRVPAIELVLIKGRGKGPRPRKSWGCREPAEQTDRRPRSSRDRASHHDYL